MRQYEAARDAVWRGAQRRTSLDRFKSVYSIFVSRVDVYTEKHVPELVAGGARAGGHRRCEADLASEPAVLVDASHAAATGDDLRQHGHEEAGRPAVEVCRGARRQRHPNESAGDERSRGKERPHVHAAWSTKCRRPRCWRRSTPKWTSTNWKSVLMREGVAKFADPQKALLETSQRSAAVASVNSCRFGWASTLAGLVFFVNSDRNSASACFARLRSPNGPCI